MKQMLSALAIFSTGAFAEPLPVDLEKVDFGAATFDLIQHGMSAGQMYYSITRDGDHIIIHDGTTLLPGIRESGSMVINAADLSPVSVVLDGDFDRTILDAELTFADGKAQGAYFFKRPSETAKARHEFDADIPAGVTLRAGIFGLVTGLPLEVGAQFDFQWFASLARAVQDVSLIVTGVETIATKEGEFATYAIAVKAEPENVIYVTTAKPHRVMRIDVIGQDMQFVRLPQSAAAKDN